MAITTMRITDATKNKLQKLKTKGRKESFEDVVLRLIEGDGFTKFLNSNMTELTEHVADELQRRKVFIPLRQRKKQK